MKQPTKLIEVYLRQLSISPKKPILQFKYDIKKTWAVMKGIFSKD